LNAIFDACFRLKREASQAAGRLIPMVVENVRGAEPWVGRAAWSFGSFYLWGDVPALMPPIHRRHDYRKSPGESWNPERPSYTKDHSWKMGDTNPAEGRKSPNDAGGWFGDGNTLGHGRQHAHGSKARKAASAKIAKIPLALSSHIARVYKPQAVAA
jgi:hypothetical protein